MTKVSLLNLISTANFDRFNRREKRENSDGEPRVDARGAVPLRAAALLLIFLVVDGAVLGDADHVGGQDARTIGDRRGGAQGEKRPTLEINDQLSFSFIFICSMPIRCQDRLDQKHKSITLADKRTNRQYVAFIFGSSNVIYLT